MYDLIVDTLNAIWRNGWSLSAGIGVVFVILRQRRFKKRLKKIIPWLFQDDSEVKDYVERQIRIENKVDLLLKERGLSWQNADSSEAIEKCSPMRRRRFYLLSWAVSIIARFVTRSTNYLMRGMKKMKQKLLSRKFLLAVVTAVLVVLNDGLSLGIDQDTVLTFAGLVITWILGESAVDTARARGEKHNGTVDYSASDNVSE